MVIHSNVTGYSSSYHNYHMVDEYYDEEQSNVYIWKKVKVDEVTTKDTSTCSSSFRLTQLVNGNRYRVHDTT